MGKGQCAGAKLQPEDLQRMLSEGELRCAGKSDIPFACPNFPDLFAGCASIPVIAAKELNGATLGAGLLHHGGLFVRGLYRAEHLQLLDQTRKRLDSIGFGKHDPFTADPVALSAMLELYEDCGLLAAITGYMGCSPLIARERAKLRRHYPGQTPYGMGLRWHQDVYFFGRMIYSVNCWAAVEPCGRKYRNPSLAVLPRRFDSSIGWDLSSGEQPIKYQIPADVMAPVLEGLEPFKPDFEAGDAILFDEMTMHCTVARPNGTGDQVVSITWFMREEGFPQRHKPMSLPPVVLEKVQEAVP